MRSDDRPAPQIRQQRKERQQELDDITTTTRNRREQLKALGEPTSFGDQLRAQRLRLKSAKRHKNDLKFKSMKELEAMGEGKTPNQLKRLRKNKKTKAAYDQVTRLMDSNQEYLRRKSAQKQGNTASNYLFGHQQSVFSFFSLIGSLLRQM